VTNDGNVRGPEQRVSRLGALKAVTLDAAYSLQLEKEVGSIVPGKLANFTILGDNPVTSDPLKIKDIAVLGTVQEGRVLMVKRTPAARAQLGPVVGDPGAFAALASLLATAPSAGDAHVDVHGDSCEVAHALAAAIAPVPESRQ
jgi:hypothetical protein